MTSPKPRQRRNRRAAENAILEAFATVVYRDGLAAANPTSIMTEAGYSKPLFYDYFGDMKGLVAKWFELNHIWPDYDFPDHIESGDELKACIKHFLLQTAESLRTNRIAQEFLIAELNHDNDYQDILEKSREQWLQGNMQVVFEHPELREADNWNLMFVVYSAINYLVLRGRSHSPHTGLQLDTDEGWNEALRRVETIIDDLITLSQMRNVMQ